MMGLTKNIEPKSIFKPTTKVKSITTTALLEIGKQSRSDLIPSIPFQLDWTMNGSGGLGGEFEWIEGEKDGNAVGIQKNWNWN